MMGWNFLFNDPSDGLRNSILIGCRQCPSLPRNGQIFYITVTPSVGQGVQSSALACSWDPWPHVFTKCLQKRGVNRE